MLAQLIEKGSKRSGISAVKDNKEQNSENKWIKQSAKFINSNNE